MIDIFHNQKVHDLFIKVGFELSIVQNKVDLANKLSTLLSWKIFKLKKASQDKNHFSIDVIDIFQTVSLATMEVTDQQELSSFVQTYPNIKFLGQLDPQRFLMKMGQVTLPNNDTYVGDFSEGVYASETYGIIKFGNGDVYQGIFRATMDYEEADLPRINRRLQRIIGKVSMHLMGNLKFRNGAIYVGQFVDGLFHGQGKYKFPNKLDHDLALGVEAKGPEYTIASKYTGYFSHGRIEGYGHLTVEKIYSAASLSTKTKSYLGYWENGKFKGEGQPPADFNADPLQQLSSSTTGQ
mmetsp:Transcript_4144/g.7013  ORF Transcript_4144/g.7013 Transcript_4144/m.7013 type:complete len:295 (+) Transcript_4144:372-1256(+)